MQMICPKCGAEMRQYERQGVVIDQCNGCRGIFLDAGELERLTQAAEAYYAPPPPPQGYQNMPTGRYEQQHRGHGGHYGGGQYGHKKKKKESFFGELFD